MDTVVIDSAMSPMNVATYENPHAFFSSVISHGQRERLKLLDSLRSALKQREFELHYQPKMVLASSEISSMEALIRWRHPQKGLIPPAFLIPMAEDCDMVVEIGAWVVEEVCRQIAQWREEGVSPVRVAINLSAEQCSQDDMFNRIMHMLDVYGVAAKWLEVEVSESTVLHDPAQALETFRALCNQGVHIAIDNFGTGYSLFSYLKRFPSHCIKIDKSFVDDLDHDHEYLEIVRAIITVSHNMGMRVVAAGIESAGQLELLRQCACDEVQGYYISPLLPASDVAAFLHGWSGDPTLMAGCLHQGS